MIPVRFKELAQVMERTNEEAAVGLSMPPVVNEVAAYRLRCYFELVISRMEQRGELKKKISQSWMEIGMITKEQDTYVIELKFDRLKHSMHCRVPSSCAYGHIKDIVAYLRYLDRELEGFIYRWYHESKQGWLRGLLFELPPLQMKEKAV